MGKRANAARQPARANTFLFIIMINFSWTGASPRDAGPEPASPRAADWGCRFAFICVRTQFHPTDPPQLITLPPLESSSTSSAAGKQRPARFNAAPGRGGKMYELRTSISHIRRLANCFLKIPAASVNCLPPARMPALAFPGDRPFNPAVFAFFRFFADKRSG